MKTVQKRSMQDMWQDSWLTGGSDAWLESQYEAWLKNPSSLPLEWQDYFQKLSPDGDVSHDNVRNFFLQIPKMPRSVPSQNGDAHRVLQQEKLADLIAAYRSFGYLQASIDPLDLHRGPSHPALALSWHGFSSADLTTVFDTHSFAAPGRSSATLGEIHAALLKTYCGTIGIEYTHISSQAEVDWIQQRMESGWAGFTLSVDEKRRILDRLVVADGLEKYIGLKYVGQKRFSLEGGDSLIPMLDTIVTTGSERGVREIVIGMAHRGRLNVLVNILGKSPASIFAVFEGKEEHTDLSGDVKYHMGFSSDIQTANGPLHLALAFNPSHLEIIAPVVQGSVRSRQRRRKDTDHVQVMPIQIHGDAAFAGQGVVMETFNLSQTRWFTVGGSIHIVINNQVGFTISNPRDARSTRYCTDIARMVEAPVLHVNGNDPEAVCFAAKLAVDYRARFKKDIVLDLVCYRRHGHNEADEPTATQPVMYRVIRSLPTPAALYADKLVQEGVIDKDLESQLAKNYRDKLDTGNSVVPLANSNEVYQFAASWQPFENTDWKMAVQTGVPADRLKVLAQKLETLPPGFELQMQVKKMMEARQKMTEGEQPLNWGYAETLAYATLLEQGYPIRLCGQDACRGTFFHRHAVLHDQNTGAVYIPLSHLSDKQSQINLIDSLLSEEAVLAFEYGYASAEPNYLTMWEAQFGDFANGAQVVFDQFISSGEQKWGRLCGLVVNLPHGYEGQGPEHSSARLERWLQLCAQNNMQVCVPSTPAQVFHMLRRQMIRPWRKPLIVMTPKSLLRHPEAVSSLEELASGQFQNVIPETQTLNPADVRRVVLCSGKVYYDLLAKRSAQKQTDTAFIRLEQIYPFPEAELKNALAPYQQVKKIIWCQEEPMNQGAWNFVREPLSALLSPKQTLSYAGRAATAAPACGHYSVHQQEQTALVDQALTG